MTDNATTRTPYQDLVLEIEAANADKAAAEGRAADAYAQMKALGYDTKAVRRLVAKRGKDQGALNEADQLLATYEAGMEGL